MNDLGKVRRFFGSAAVRQPNGVGAAQTTAEVRDYYERMTAAYLEGFGPVFQGSRPESTEELLRYVAEALDLKPGMRLLDAGCGVGGPALWLARHHELIIEGLTISSVQAEAATRVATDAALDGRLHFRQGDFHQLPELYPTESFDRVMFLESLCHAESYRRVLAGARDVLKPGGALYIKDFHIVDQRRDPGRNRAQARDLAALNSLYRLTLPRQGDLVSLLCELGFLIRYMRMPAYEPTYTHWSDYERVAGRHWAPASGAPGEVIQAVEFFCLKT